MHLVWLRGTEEEEEEEHRSGSWEVVSWAREYI